MDPLLRDRLLLYVRSLDIPPQDGLQLALTCLDDVGEPSFVKVIDKLRQLLNSHGLNPDRKTRLPLAFPPANLTHMITDKHISKKTKASDSNF